MIQWLKELLQSQLTEGAGGAVQDTSPPARVRARQGETLAKQLALVIDLNVCVGCQACVTSC